ncbi:hypothetical protein DPMN_035101 [Dreissena polymorpha]|uniref:Uncharacterized protein n=1 Tax=Dreissena polymorpha TaxID=45954 RepID=A0A9D4MB98_DREPO|nr:hypothetical protein DPMN_035101 [Dreissena polymorpha]
MNFPGAPQYGTQFGIAYPPCNQFGTFSQGSQVPPMWASEMIEDVKKIKTQVSKIDKIEECMNKMIKRVEFLEEKVNSIETSLNFFNEQFEMTKKTLTESKNQIKDFHEKVTKIEDTLHTYDKKITQIDEATDKLEFHSLRENLLFHGIAETSSQENCDEIIKTLIKEVLHIDKNIILDRVHRIGQSKPSKTRPIVAKFHLYEDRELVRKTAIERSQDLKALHQGIGIQQTRGTLEKRRNKQHLVDRERAAGRTTKWAGPKLLSRGADGNFREVNM